MPLVVGENSYVTVAEADAYFSDRIYSDSWTNFSNKEAALISATMYLDNLCTWYGEKSDENQDLAFPRDETDDVVPTNIKNSQMEIAISMIDSGSASDQGNAELKKLQADVVKLEFFENKNYFKDNYTSSVVKNMLGKYGTCSYADGTIQSVPLER